MKSLCEGLHEVRGTSAGHSYERYISKTKLCKSDFKWQSPKSSGECFKHNTGCFYTHTTKAKRLFAWNKSSGPPSINEWKVRGSCYHTKSEHKRWKDHVGEQSKTKKPVLIHAHFCLDKQNSLCMAGVVVQLFPLHARPRPRGNLPSQLTWVSHNSYGLHLATLDSQ